MDLKSQDSRDIDCATLWKLNDAIILIRYKDGVNLTLQDAIDVRDGCIDLFKGRKFLGLVDARNMGGTLERKASDFFAQNEELNAVLMSQALVVNSLAIKLIARFYIKISKPKRDARIFGDLEEALRWLESKKNLLS